MKMVNVSRRRVYNREKSFNLKKMYKKNELLKKKDEKRFETVRLKFQTG